MTEKIMNQLKDFMHRLATVNEEIFSQGDYNDFLKLCTKDISIITYIGDNPSCIAKDICQHYGMPKTTVVSATSRLEQRGYICRTKAPFDGRAQVLTLTQLGEKVYEQHHRYEEVFLQKLLEFFRKEDYELLSEILERSNICKTIE